jgi:hypothetical protein
METRQDQAERKDRKFRLSRRLLQSGWSERSVRQLYRVIDWMMELPKELESDYWNDVIRLKEESKVPFVTTIERYAREEGLERGAARALFAALGRC